MSDGLSEGISRLTIFSKFSGVMVRGVFFGISASGTYTTDIFGDALWTMLKIGMTQTDIDGISNTFVKDLAQAIFNGGYSTKYRLHTAQCFKSPDAISEEWNAPGKYYDRCGNVTGISVPIGAKIGIMVGNIPAGAQVGLLVLLWYSAHRADGQVHTGRHGRYPQLRD